MDELSSKKLVVLVKSDIGDRLKKCLLQGKNRYVGIMI